MNLVMDTQHRTPCINLRESFKGVYKFGWDEAYHAERSEFRAYEAAWLTIIPGKFGKVFLWGGRRLAAYCPAGMAKREQLAVLGVVKQGGGAAIDRQSFSDVIVVFEPEQLAAVAEVLQLRKPRKPLNPAQRAALEAGGKAHRFQKRTPDGAK